MGKAVFPHSLRDNSHYPPGVTLQSEADDEVRSPGESHPQALSEPDVNLSVHPAPIIQPTAKSPSASAQIIVAHVVIVRQANTLRSCYGSHTVCTSCAPTSNTQPPPIDISRFQPAFSAWCAERPSRNPYEQSRKSCSQMGSPSSVHGLPQCHARLGSGCRPTLPGETGYSQGPPARFQIFQLNQDQSYANP